jgi:hypothetical protein
MQNWDAKTLAIAVISRLLRCLAAQSPVIEFALAVASVTLAGNLSKSQGLAALLDRAGEAAALLGFLLAGSVGLSVSHSSLT